jgi:hypothetical protein
MRATGDTAMANTRIGKFELGDELGRGPLGKVYAATNTETGEEVVFRGFAQPEKVDEEHWSQAIQRFTEELTAARRLDHPNIAKVLEFGEADGLYYVATENFRGKNLRQLLDEQRHLEEEEANSIARQLCHVIDYAATQNAVHGDLTPYNVMLLDDGTVKVINYGLGHIRSKLGSPYVAPEVLQGAPGDFRSDLHAIGVLWFGMLVGHVPFRGENPEELGQAILGHRPPPASAARPHVQGIIEKLLEKDPDKRYDSGVMVINDLVSGTIPAGYEYSVIRPPAVTVSWNVHEYQPLPSVGDYKLEDSDVREIRERLAVRKDVRQLERVDVGKRLALAVAAVLVLGFLCDGVRQISRRPRLQVVDATGTVEVFARLRKAWGPLGAGQLISSADALRTAGGASVTLRAFNGTRLKLDENSRLMVYTAGYDAESKSRNISCDLQQGRLWAKVKPAGGKKPPFEVHCRGSVVTVKGTVLGVSTSGETDGAEVECLEGQVAVGDGSSETPVVAGKLAELFGGQLTGELQALSPDATELMKKLEAELSEDSFGEVLRLALSTFEEKTIVAPLAGIASLANVGGKSKADSQAIILAHGSMMALTRAMELSTEYPDKVKLETLEGIELDEEGRERILASFEGHKLESYKIAGSGYEITARVKDSEHSLIVARDGKVEVVEEAQGKAGGKGDAGGQ